ncbi:MAG: PRC-barrel domain-containing protein [Phototrophicaceae bacterium]
MSLALLSTGSLLNTSVKNADGEDIGTISEIMIDIQHGTIAYAVLSFGGFMGLGEKLFAIPWQALTADTVDEKFILNIRKDILEKADGFDKNDWPDVTDVQWNYNTHVFYGYDPYWD